MAGRPTNVFMGTFIVPGKTHHRTFVCDDLAEGFSACVEVAHELGMDFTLIPFQEARQQITAILEDRIKLSEDVMAKVNASGNGYVYMVNVTKGVRL